MLDFSLYLILFNFLCGLCTLMILLLFVIHIRNGRNSLLLCSCIIILVMFGLIFAGSILFGNDIDSFTELPFCGPQGIGLNYCFISIHALVACMMYDAWSHAIMLRIRVSPLQKQRLLAAKRAYYKQQQQKQLQQLNMLENRNAGGGGGSSLYGKVSQDDIRTGARRRVLTDFPSDNMSYGAFKMEDGSTLISQTSAPHRAAQDAARKGAFLPSVPSPLANPPSMAAAPATVHANMSRMSRDQLSLKAKSSQASSPVTSASSPVFGQALAYSQAINSTFEWSPGYLIISFGIPLVPTILLIMFHQHFDIIQPRAYFCYVTGPFWIKFLCHSFWFMLFTLFGSFCSVHLLFKTIWTREKSLGRGRTTQLSRFSVFRVGLATFVYSLISFGSFLPTFIFFPSDPPMPYYHQQSRRFHTTHELFQPPSMSPLSARYNPALISPYENPALCISRNRLIDPVQLYYANIRCPSFLSFAPVIVALGFFCMYGFGKHARKTYSSIYWFGKGLLLYLLLKGDAMIKQRSLKAGPSLASVQLTMKQQKMELRVASRQFPGVRKPIAVVPKTVQQEGGGILRQAASLLQRTSISYDEQSRDQLMVQAASKEIDINEEQEPAFLDILLGILQGTPPGRSDAPSGDQVVPEFMFPLASESDPQLIQNEYHMDIDYDAMEGGLLSRIALSSSAPLPGRAFEDEQEDAILFKREERQSIATSPRKLHPPGRYFSHPHILSRSTDDSFFSHHFSDHLASKMHPSSLPSAELESTGDLLPLSLQLPSIPIYSSMFPTMSEIPMASSSRSSISSAITEKREQLTWFLKLKTVDTIGLNCRNLSDATEEDQSPLSEAETPSFRID